MGHTIYLHQQGICWRQGLLVYCTAGNNCVMFELNLPGAAVCVSVCVSALSVFSAVSSNAIHNWHCSDNAEESAPSVSLPSCRSTTFCIQCHMLRESCMLMRAFPALIMAIAVNVKQTLNCSFQLNGLKKLTKAAWRVGGGYSYHNSMFNLLPSSTRAHKAGKWAA